MAKKTNDKVYAVIVESNDVTFLSLQYAESLEEAFTLARIEFARTTTMVSKGSIPPKSLVGAKIGLFTIKGFEELKRETTEFRHVHSGAKQKFLEGLSEPEKAQTAAAEEGESPKKAQKSALTAEQRKNELMTKIIKNKNVKLYEENKKCFTAHEADYIQAQLKKQVKD